MDMRHKHYIIKNNEIDHFLQFKNVSFIFFKSGHADYMV